MRKKIVNWLGFERLRLILVTAFLGALFAIPMGDPLKQAYLPRLLPFSGNGPWLGTDELGRDLAARIWSGGKLALFIGLSSSLIALLSGVVLAVISVGFPKIDHFLSRAMDAVMGFPMVLAAVVTVALLGPGISTLPILIGVLSCPSVFRLTRAILVRESKLEYVQAAVALGKTHWGILFQQILPAAGPSLWIVFGTLIGTSVLEAASLSFLGLGAIPPMPEWGAMVADGRKYLMTTPHLVVVPSLALLFFSSVYLWASTRISKLGKIE